MSGRRSVAGGFSLARSSESAESFAQQAEEFVDVLIEALKKLRRKH
jgi:hypothetical protein